MFRRIFPKDIRLSISTRIALIFGILTFFFVALSTYLITNTLKTAVLNQKSDELLENTIRISHEFKNFETQSELVKLAIRLSNDKTTRWQNLQNSFDIVDRHVRQARIPYYVSYTIYYIADDNVPIFLGSNDPYLPLLPITEYMQPVRHLEKNYYTDGDLNILYLSIPAGSLNIQTSLNMEVDSIDKLLTKLPIVMLFFAIPLLLISFVTAKFLSSRMLQPVADITRTANEISASQLDKRIPEPNSKDELQELAKTFNLLFARLQQDFNRERRFTSDVSHELRTPLAVLLGHLDLLRRWGKTDTDILDSSLETLYSETKSMQSLVENLLLLSRSERQAPPEKLLIKINYLLNKIVNDLKLVSPEVSFSIECLEETVLFTNPDILTQILRILITNSIFYSPAPAKVTLLFNEEEQSLSVIDKGNGIAKKDLPHIFERLYRTDESRNHRTGGSGLGLAIAKTLARNLGAQIYAKSDGLEKGTCITILFPKETKYTQK
ncbi:MAG: HAMP domain-containing protein [Treponema sp.]|jgi:signal transduction histidine kinase|nr:HAMP domain-containing protein [Treponema sp.]